MNQHNSQPSDLDSGALRILIVSTPKTGNTWLARLLSSVYGLPQRGFVLPFDKRQARNLGARWVLFHHARPDPGILDWIEEAKPVLVSAMRHPADVLVSLYHHVNGFRSGAVDADAVQKMLSGPYERADIYSDASGSFRDDLECSLSWVRTGLPHIVRYEDLWRDTHREMMRLTSLIRPVPERRIELAIERCDFTLMRRLAGKHGGFFRSGKVGNWPEALPGEVRRRLQEEPYRLLIEEFGYSMDPADPAIAAPRVERPSMNPFKRFGGRFVGENLEEVYFENGVPVAPFLVDLYLDLYERRLWDGDPSLTGPGSFYEWLNQPSGCGEREGYGQIVLTNLALSLHRMRPDLGQAFANLDGPARADYADWFVRGGARAVEIAPRFIEPVERSLIEWAGARAPEDREEWAWWPKLPNFALHLYRRYEHLRIAYGDILCFDRWNYLEWIVEHQGDADINPEFVKPVAASLKKLAKVRRLGRFVPGARVRVADVGR